MRSGHKSVIKAGFRSWWKCEAVKSGGCLSEHDKQSRRMNNLLWLSTSDMVVAAAGHSGDRGWWLAQPMYSIFFAVFLPTLCTHSQWRADTEWTLSHGKLWLRLETFLLAYIKSLLMASWLVAILKMYPVLTAPLCFLLVSAENTEEGEGQVYLILWLLLSGYPFSFQQLCGVWEKAYGWCFVFALSKHKT